MKAGCNRHAPVSERLVAARKLFAENQQPAAIPLVDSAFSEAQTILSQATSLEDPMLAYYYAARLMKKFAQIPSNLDEPNIARRHMARYSSSTIKGRRSSCKGADPTNGNLAILTRFRRTRKSGRVRTFVTKRHEPSWMRSESPLIPCDLK